MSVVNHSRDFRRPTQRRPFNRSPDATAIRPMRQAITSAKRAYVVVLSLSLLAVVFAGVVALRVAILLHAFHY